MADEWEERRERERQEAIAIERDKIALSLRAQEAYEQDIAGYADRRAADLAYPPPKAEP